MNKKKTIDKIFVSILFGGILGIFWLMRDKHISFLNFSVSALAYSCFLGGFIYLSKKFPDTKRSWIYPVITASLMIWFSYLATARMTWNLWIILVLIFWATEWSWQRFKAKNPPDGSSELQI